MENNNDQNNNNEPRLNDVGLDNPAIAPITAALFGLVGVFILYQIGGSLISLAIFGLDMKDANMNAVRLLTMGSQILFILLPALLLSKLVYQDVTSVIRLKLPKMKEIGIFVVGLIILTPLLQNYLEIQNYLLDKLTELSPFFSSAKEFLDQLDEFVEETYKSILSADNFFEGSLIVLVVAAVPALCEEVFFRGYVQKSFELKTTPFWGAALSAVFFGLYHFNPYGLLALIALGFYFGYVTYKSNSIIIAFVLHFLNNFLAVMAFLIYGEEDLISSDVVNTSSIQVNLISFFLLLSIFFVFIYFVNKMYGKTHEQ